eukprot:CAMPEP_0170467360 /NCGR_PEP_ID=MMETSP0123-20130129/10969_1 /TAXON_ID=182087 /ORGANISM="Favella ehrenbergii, Strain Fehren 1" /LENGTH=126 /DNA_ID=CAMNT_0010733709 /DNA_START=135 /DNA_END=515 /DNA_ORIENTATION=-
MQLIISMLFIMVFVNPYDARTRKMLFYSVSIGQLISIVTYIAIFLYLLFTDDWIKDACHSTSSYVQQQNCLDFAKTGLIISFCWGMAIMLLFIFMIWQVLFFGWKEQEEKAENGGAGKTSDGYTQA